MPNATEQRAKADISPYKNLPDARFWRRAVSQIDPYNVDPVTKVEFTISKDDLVATAGSCFAQHIARTLVKSEFNFLITETGDREYGYGVFPARFGNIYTPRQLLQLFELAYGLRDADPAWQRPDKRFVDGFRPLIDERGFADAAEVRADRRKHLAAVRRMFETCDVFIFTLGLTEGWRSRRTGLVYPLPPGVAAIPEAEDEFEFVNFSVPEMSEDMLSFLDKLRLLNQNVKIIITVSPVPLIATFEDRHVLNSTVYSKSALRVVAEEVSRNCSFVSYFPSYEIITGPHHRSRFFKEDLRSISDDGVDHVMSIFSRHYLSTSKSKIINNIERGYSIDNNRSSADSSHSLYHIICDEESLDQ